MEKKLDIILCKLDTLDEIKEEIAQTKTQINVFKELITNNTHKMKILESKLEKQQDTINYFEKQIKKRNLLFVGVPELETNKNELEEKIISIVNNHLKIELASSDVENLIRLGQKREESDRTISVTFSSLKTRNNILSKRYLLKETKIYINEDLPAAEYKKRKEKLQLRKDTKAQHEENKSKQEHIPPVETATVRKKYTIKKSNFKANSKEQKNIVQTTINSFVGTRN